MIEKRPIKDFYNRVIGYILTDTVTGVQTARNFYNRILGTYDPRTDLTKDFYNKIVSRGNTLSVLILEDDRKTSGR